MIDELLKDFFCDWIWEWVYKLAWIGSCFLVILAAELAIVCLIYGVMK